MCWARGGGELRRRQRYCAETDRAFWPGPLRWWCRGSEAAPLPISSARSRHDCAPRTEQPDRPALLGGCEAAYRRAERQPVGARQPDHGGPCGGGASGSAGHDPDGGPCALGLKSTVLGIDGDDVTLASPRRPPREKIEKVLGRKLHEAKAGSHVTSPDNSPLTTRLTPLRLNSPAQREARHCLPSVRMRRTLRVRSINLSPRGDLSKPLRISLPRCATSMKQASRPSRSCQFPPRSRRGDQRPAQARLFARDAPVSAELP